MHGFVYHRGQNASTIVEGGEAHRASHIHEGVNPPAPAVFGSPIEDAIHRLKHRFARPPPISGTLAPRPQNAAPHFLARHLQADTTYQQGKETRQYRTDSPTMSLVWVRMERAAATPQQVAVRESRSPVRQQGGRCLSPCVFRVERFS